MASPRRRLLSWALRLVGLGLVAIVLITQVRWRDEIGLRDERNTRLRGTVVEAPDGAFEVTSPEGSARLLRPSEVATRSYGGREVPDVTLGFPSLARRLSGRLDLAALALLGLVSLVVLTAWRWQTLLRAVDLVLGFRQAVRLTFIGGFFNIAVPGSTGGDVVKAFYAARVFHAPTRAVVSVFLDRMLGLFALVLFAGGVIFLGPSHEGYGTPRLFVAVVLAAGIAVGALFLSRRLRRGVGLSWLLRRLPFQHVLLEADAALRLYRKRLSVVGVAVAVSLVNHAGSAVCVWWLAQGLGIRGIELGTAMALVPLVSLLSAIPLLPGGWGVGELAFAYFFGQVGVPVTEAVGLSVVFRLASLSANLPGGVLWLSWKGHPTREALLSEVEAADHEMEESATGAEAT